ncbi:hypothetical protein BDZ89DRAFT_1075115 [Hymenopellis radicata]|nr:hypothetical protein BDZ89DRAFT_1075115 [Hymenopellis radicata]
MNGFGCVEYSSLLEYSTRSAISAIRLVSIHNPSAVLATGTRVMDHGSDPGLTR